jgi:hypothetical protein
MTPGTPVAGSCTGSFADCFLDQSVFPCPSCFKYLSWYPPALCLQRQLSPYAASYTTYPGSTYAELSLKGGLQERVND